MTLQQALLQGTSLLEDAGIAASRLTAEVLPGITNVFAWTGSR
jgi:hypothetical protein